MQHATQHIDDEDNEQAACSIIIFMLSSMADDGEQIEAADRLLCCASCGIAEIDDVELVPCDGCDLVKYCGDDCQKNHWSQHKEACKKRAAELRDELLFKQPESSHHGDCPICCLPLSLDHLKSRLMACCSKVICIGCEHANMKREKELRLQHSCPFCREPVPKITNGHLLQNMKRVAMNDPNAMCFAGVLQYKKGDYDGAFQYFTKAAELGDAEAHFRLSDMYYRGRGIEKDERKAIHFMEEAAISGHHDARYNLGWNENENGNAERAAKHWIIAATLGDDDSIKALMQAFKEGFVNKQDLATALRAHQAAVDATKSPQRLEAEEYYRILKEERGLC